MHPAPAVRHSRRLARLSASGLCTHRGAFCISNSMGLSLRIFFQTTRGDLTDNRLAALIDVNMLDKDLLLALTWYFFSASTCVAFALVSFAASVRLICLASNG